MLKTAFEILSAVFCVYGFYTFLHDAARIFLRKIRKKEGIEDDTGRKRVKRP